MSDFDANRTFRGLPLTPEHDAEVRHYIKKKSSEAMHGIHLNCTTCSTHRATKTHPAKKPMRKPARLPSARRPSSTKAWTRSKTARNGTRPWKPKR